MISSFPHPSIHPRYSQKLIEYRLEVLHIDLIGGRDVEVVFLSGEISEVLYRGADEVHVGIFAGAEVRNQHSARGGEVFILDERIVRNLRLVFSLTGYRARS